MWSRRLSLEIRSTPRLAPARRNTRDSTGGLNPLRGQGRTSSASVDRLNPDMGHREPARGRRIQTGSAWYDWQERSLEGEGFLSGGGFMPPIVGYQRPACTMTSIEWTSVTLHQSRLVR